MRDTHPDTTAGHLLVRSSDGVTAWIDPLTGRIRPYVAGGDGPDDPPARPAPLTAEQQAMVDRLIGEARQSGTTQARAEFESWLSDQADAAGQQGADEVNRLRGERDAARNDATQATGERDKVVLDAFAMVALIGAGIPHANVTDGLALLGHQVGDDVTALAGKADALKERLPALVTPASDDGSTPQPRPGVPPAKPPKVTPPAETEFERGQRLAREQYAHLRIA